MSQLGRGDEMIDITVDQLIAGLCTVRGKNPDIGTKKLNRASIYDGKFFLEITDGKECNVFSIEPETIET